MIALLVVVLLAAAAAVYVIVSPDAGIRWALGGEESREAVETAAASEAAGADGRERPAAEEPAPDAQPSLARPATPPPPPAPPAGTDTGEGSAATAREEVPEEAAPQPEAVAPFTRVQNITWTDTAGGTEVTLHLDGSVREWDYSNLRLDAPPPRHLVRISGVDAPFPRPAIPVGGDLLRQIRVGYHPKPGGDELHVVLDLADPAVVVEGSEAEDREIRLFLSRRAGS